MGMYTNAFGTVARKPKKAPKEKVPRAAVKLGPKRPIVQKYRERNSDLDRKSLAFKTEFRFVAATVLHRYPVITPDTPQWEQDMEMVQETIADYQREWFLSKTRGTPAQFISEHNPTQEEIIESMPFEPASRVTEADRTNDRRSTNRRLQDSLYLIVKRNRPENPWQFPQGKLLPEETLRQGSERVIDRAVGKVHRWFISNCPIGHYAYPYNEELQEQRDTFGAKVFFYRAQLYDGTVKLETKLYTDYAWIARDEVGEYFDPDTADYMKHLLPY